MTVDTEMSDPDDCELMDAVRQGRGDCFAVLYQRHVAAASAYAGRLLSQHPDAKDVVAEAFLRVFGILSRGLGPQDSFRPYLLRAVRNAAFDHLRAQRRVELTPDLTDLESVVPFHDVTVERLDRVRAVAAFRNLPPRWQEVIWITVVEERSVEEAAQQLGINPNSLTSLAYRAREGLRHAYLLTSLAGEGAECRRIAPTLARVVRGSGTRSARATVDEHLAGCAACRNAVTELRQNDAALYRQPQRATSAARPGEPIPA